MSALANCPDTILVARRYVAYSGRILHVNQLTVWRCVRVGVGIVILLLLIRTFLVMGLFLPVRVASNSMAPALLGPHRRPVCPACGASHVVDAVAPVAAVACPRCGASPIDVPRLTVLPGDRVLVDRLGPLRWRRWQLVVFRCPDSADALCVKRIVGLPGESVALRGGELFVNGRLARKSLRVQRSMAQRVHPPPHVLAGRDRSLWKIDGRPSGWTRRQEHFAWHRPVPQTSDQVDWLTCQPQDGVTETMIYHGVRSRRGATAGDVMVTFTLVPEGPGQLRLALRHGRQRMEARLDCPHGRAKLLRNGDPVATGRLPPTVSIGQPSAWEWSLIDARWLLAVDGRIVVHVDRLWRPPDRDGPPLRLAIGTGNLPAQLSDVSVWCDVHYGLPAHTRPRTPGVWQLANDQVMVLGDNSFRSRDSRHWRQGPGLPTHLIVGSVVGSQ